ncbi:MAG: class I SAM-dependent methyltransferase [Deltaproteobacteria bacterium]|nr:class I SAM-dependent methyltransferase [Deltaproteobacteria bacterium]MBW2329644.1 class I SAM-dependent methyltransferase [Deltaproteobacteria bacterium]
MSRHLVRMQNFNHCILCYGSDFRIIHQKDQWQYLRCLECGLVCIHPKPSPQALMKDYQDYLTAKAEEVATWEMTMKPVVDKSADLIESRTKAGGGRLLDIGCGYGFFLHEMRSRGWQVEGIEISRPGRRYVRNRRDIHVHSEPLEDLSLHENSFDVVTLFYVIEHVLDPLRLLTEVKRILKPDGLVLLRWPHSTPIVRILGPMSRKLDLYHTPYHLYDFSPDTIKKLLLLSGFKEIETRIVGHTRPSKRLGRWASTVFGQLGEILYFLSGGNLLLPGISKTTLAFKASK